MKKGRACQNSWVVALLFSLSLAAGLRYISICVAESSMEKSTDDVVTIFDKTNLVCFGRFVIAVPDGAIIEHGAAELDGRFSVYRDQVSIIDNVIASRLIETEKEKEYLADDEISELPLIGKVIDGMLPNQKLIFGARGSLGYTIHSYIPLGGNIFVLEVDNELQKEKRIKEMNRIASLLRLRDDSEVPAEPGFCVDGGFLDIEPEYENTAFGLRFKEFPDVRFSIEMRKNLEYLRDSSSPSKLRENARERATASQLATFFSRITTLREGRRQLDGWEGEEILTRRTAYKDDTDAHEFRFFSVGKKQDALHPLLDIRMDTGVDGNAKARVKPSLTNEAAVALWDKLLPTIRVRRPSDASPPIHPAPTAPLESIVRSGDTCPQSGWWECADKRKIDGARRRTFKAGEKFPLVLANGGVGLWRTLIGDTLQIAKVEWKLTEHAQSYASSADKNEHGVSQTDSNTKDGNA